ncbi:MAG: metalloregulator ArsR/SmtB family transcription factor [Desulfuromonadaceae bacterium]|nr:metalloregulator ArsR/SmtB family transcription factor [Desulfuromonadaceae bacterium]MDD2733474.1 metalloregulator ArsR/SmtB family transcription factor [Desulfuromonadaceae bacterium]MDD5104356.1 metalloregulator ArsR/SmtB family transcription factor [Desulfuromonadaceae bacterium]MDD5104365.1 metalloregulator ArsR/SmtB family transcription factor [Desulfuromonadaceae bacterium]
MSEFTICSINLINEAKVTAVRNVTPPEAILVRLAETFKVLGDPTRVRILHALSLEELCVCDIASLLGTTKSAISHQLRLLRSLRIVRHRKDGRIVYYSLDDSHVGNLLREGLSHITSQGELP